MTKKGNSVKKHGGAPVYESQCFLGQTPISSSKMLVKIDYFS